MAALRLDAWLVAYSDNWSDGKQVSEYGVNPQFAGSGASFARVRVRSK